MIEKLQKKFFLIFTIAFLIVAIGIILFIGVSNYRSIDRNIREVLRVGLNIPGRPSGQGNEIESPKPPQKPEGAEHAGVGDTENDSNVGMPGEAPEENPAEDSDLRAGFRAAMVLTIQIDAQGKRIDTKGDESNFNLTSDQLDNIAETCMNNVENYGFMDDYPFAYMKLKDDGGTRIAIYDITTDKSNMKMIIISSLIAAVVSIIALTIISFLLSKWCIGPVRTAWEKQKRFLADASHELKTPITVITANTKIAIDGMEDIEADTQAIKKPIKYIESEANHMNDLVNQILFLAKTDNDPYEYKMSKVNISDICMGDTLTFESVAFEKNIDIIEDIDDNIYVNADEEKVNVLFRVLYDNACKYSPEGEKIYVSLKRKGNHARFEIRNMGECISKEKLDHIFDRFYRGDESHNRKVAGYGLGLSMAHNIATRHSWKLSAQSDENEGTSFIIRIPKVF